MKKKPSRGKSPREKKASLKSPDSGAARGPRSERSPSVKQRRYVEGRVAGKSKRKAALDAGYSQAVADNTKDKLDEKPAVKRLFATLMTQAGATDELLAQRIYEGLHAKSVMRETLHAEREVLVDFAERREMVELALKLKGHLIDKHELRMVRTLEEILEASNE